MRWGSKTPAVNQTDVCFVSWLHYGNPIAKLVTHFHFRTTVYVRADKNWLNTMFPIVGFIKVYKSDGALMILLIESNIVLLQFGSLCFFFCTFYNLHHILSNLYFVLFSLCNSGYNSGISFRLSGFYFIFNRDFLIWKSKISVWIINIESCLN